MSNILYKYYKRRVDNLISQLEKVKTSSDMKDIHNVRKEIKKIRSIIYFLRYISPKSLDKHAFNEQFNDLKELFEYTGKLREAQVNLMNIEKYKLASPEAKSYKDYLKIEENKLLSGFKKITDEFNTQKLDDNSLKIKKLFKDNSNEKTAVKSRDFIMHLVKKINKIQKKASETNKYHEVRIHLRKLAAISELLFEINKDKKYKKFIREINKTSSELGNWHDRVILRDSILEFIKKIPKTTNHRTQTTELKSLITRINKTNKLKAESFDSDINSSLKLFKK